MGRFEDGYRVNEHSSYRELQSMPTSALVLAMIEALHGDRVPGDPTDTWESRETVLTLAAGELDRRIPAPSGTVPVLPRRTR